MIGYRARSRDVSSCEVDHGRLVEQYPNSMKDLKRVNRNDLLTGTYDCRTTYNLEIRWLFKYLLDTLALRRVRKDIRPRKAILAVL